MTQILYLPKLGFLMLIEGAECGVVALSALSFGVGMMVEVEVVTHVASWVFHILRFV